MKLISFCIFILIFSCTSIPSKKGDEFDVVIEAMKTRSIDTLDLYWGDDKKTEQIVLEKGFKQINYPLTNKHSSIDVFIDLKTNRITRIAVFFWKDFDNYTYLKKRFEKYEWVEKELKNKPGDVLQEEYRVKISDLGMTFTYDNYAPKRKVMWIFFD
jgi:hypothetical protein